jgi:hypothetical protein
MGNSKWHSFTIGDIVIMNGSRSLYKVITPENSPVIEDLLTGNLITIGSRRTSLDYLCQKATPDKIVKWRFDNGI